VTNDNTAIVRSQFGAAAADYAASEVHANGESLTRIVTLAEPRKTWDALDIATGAGHMAAAFAPHVKTVVATDITAEMLSEAAKLAASRNLSNMTTATAQAGALPFENETFDLVCCRLAAHHFPSLEDFAGEVRRVLKPGGRFALVDNVAPDRERLPEATEDELEDVIVAYNAFEKLRDPSHGFAPQPEFWTDLLEAEGFSIAAHEQFGKEIAFKPWVSRMRCSAEVIGELERILTIGLPALRKFLDPRRDSAGELHFTLQEFLIVADKHV
jgi:ubiquinone/menaquinone biosynthesis C-methylase UbiE